MRRLAIAVTATVLTLTLFVPTASAEPKSPSVDQIKAYAKTYVLANGGHPVTGKGAARQWGCFAKVIHYESRWNHKAQNGIHYGLGQLASSKASHDGKPYLQVRDTWKYMVKRYPDKACGAWDHIVWIGWY